MCGIGGFYFFKENEKIDQNRLLNALIFGIDNRGGDACGFSAFNANGLLLHEKAACRAKDFIKGRVQLTEPAQMAMVHTRFATQGHEGFMRNNHPVVSEGVHVVHNGHISNDTTIFQKISVPRRAQVDTEAIPASVAAHGWENWKTALEDLDGGYAVAMASENHPGELILAKGEMSPLVYFTNGRVLVWSSTEECLLGSWKACIGKPPIKAKLKHLKFGEAIVIKDNVMTLEKFNAKEQKWVYYEYQNTQGGTTTGRWDSQSWNDEDYDSGWVRDTNGGWHRKKSAEDSAKALMPGKSISGVGTVDLGAHAAEVEALWVEHDILRRKCEEIMNSGEDWWHDQALLIEFNEKWKVIREIKDEIEEITWKAVTEIEELGETDDEDYHVEIQCPACMQMTPLPEMDTRPGIDHELYCADCLEQWEDLTAAGYDRDEVH